MKESGMEKLIELFNKHIEENTGQKYYLNERDVKDKLDSLLILRYFIKWLVDNDKIDESKIEIHWFSFYESVLMELAIKDNPIEFLVSLLK